MHPATFQQWFSDQKIPAFRHKQVQDWVLHHGILDYAAMSNLPAELRTSLAEELPLLSLEILRSIPSDDGQTTKYLLRLKADQKITEMVIMRHEKGRKTLCVSSQVGCPVGCSFCATGQMGFARNLTAEEIFDQAVLARSLLLQEHSTEKKGDSTQPHVPTNVVFMGMGEPFLNYDNVMQAVGWLGQHLQLGGRRLTISTSGVITRIREFTALNLQVNLAISLHAITDQRRSELMPINKNYPLAELREAIRLYMERSNRKVFFEYIMIEGVNDSVEEARLLRDWLPPKLSHVNLIPYNPVPGPDFQTSTPERIKAFADVLKVAGIPLTVRYNMGGDVGAACGQLASEEARVVAGGKKARRRLAPVHG